MVIIDDLHSCFESGNFAKFKFERYGEGKVTHPSA
jgi:hypothetical protein